MTRDWRPWLVIVAVVFAVHGPTLFFDFTYFDDDKLILMDQAFLRDPSNVARAFQRDVFGTKSPTYRPMLTLSFMGEAWAGGKGPLVYHLTNVALHALATIGVFLTLVTLGYARGPSLLASVIFAVHPVLAFAVAWIPGRNDSLLTVLALSAWLAFRRYVRTQGWGAYAAHVVLFAAAVFTKETAVALPLVATLYLGLLAREALRVRPTALLAVGWLAVVLGWLALRAPIVAAARPRSVTLETLALNARSILELLGTILVPFALPISPTFSRRGMTIGIVAALLVVAAIVLLPRERRTYGLFGVTWFVVLLGPTLAVHQSAVGFEYMHHRAYLPLVGLTIVAVEVFGAVRTGQGARARALAAIAVAAILAGVTIVHARQFEDGVTFWWAAVRDVPRSADARHSLGYVLQRRGDLDGAEAAYRAAIELEPAHPTLSPKYHLNLGIVYELKGRLDDAARKYADAIALAPDYAAAHTNLGLLHYGAGQVQAAETEFLLSIALDPRFTSAHVSMCGLRLRQNRLEEAERFCHSALALRPDSQRALVALAVIYYIQGRYRESIQRVDELRARGAPVDRLIPDVVAGLEAYRK
ncbi:MAG: tetratricopeptide repeat protein [Candidatus Rokubacteria bacterium]|nr:tetratricopeptide repeat protein [Candidatus Rokubacteria bacterium]